MAQRFSSEYVAKAFMFWNHPYWRPLLQKFEKGRELIAVCLDYYQYSHPSLKLSSLIEDDVGYILSPEMPEPYLLKCSRAERAFYTRWVDFLSANS